MSLTQEFDTVTIIRSAHAAGWLLSIGLAAAAWAGAPGRTVTDDSGRQVSVAQPPLRIVSLAPGATELLFAAGAGSQVIATVEYSDEPPAARRIARIGDVAAVDMERLVSLHPDVVVVWASGGNPAQRQKIAGLHIPMYEQQVARLADIPAGVRRLGVLAGTAGHRRPRRAADGGAPGKPDHAVLRAPPASLRACCCRSGTGRSIRSAASS